MSLRINRRVRSVPGTLYGPEESTDTLPDRLPHLKAYSYLKPKTVRLTFPEASQVPEILSLPMFPELPGISDRYILMHKGIRTIENM